MRGNNSNPNNAARPKTGNAVGIDGVGGQAVEGDDLVEDRGLVHPAVGLAVEVDARRVHRRPPRPRSADLRAVHWLRAARERYQASTHTAPHGSGAGQLGPSVGVVAGFGMAG